MPVQLMEWMHVPLMLKSSGDCVQAGKMGYFLVGLPDNAVKEGYMRIAAATSNIA